MPQDLPGAVSPLAPSEGSYDVPEVGLARRWMAGRDLPADLRDEALEVIDIAFNHDVAWHRLPVAPADHFDWKYGDRPTGVTIGLTLDSDGRVVGFGGTARRIWSLQGRPFVTRATYDLCRLPEWQRRGIREAFQPFSGRDWHPSDDFSFEYFTHPNDRARAIERGERAPANETHDYVRILRVRPFRRVFDLLIRGVGRLLRRGATERPATALSNTSKVVRARAETRRTRAFRYLRQGRRAVAALLARRTAPNADEWSVATIGRFEDRHALFVNRALSQFEFFGERPVSYLNWRYCDDRGGPFTVRVATRLGPEREALGYAVTRVYRGDAFLVDILALPGELSVAESLIRDAIALAKADGATSMMTRLPQHHPYGPALKRAGFYDVGNQAGELIAPRDTPPADLAFLDLEDARIHHVLADSDDV
jgi:hypothetical protein